MPASLPRWLWHMAHGWADGYGHLAEHFGISLWQIRRMRRRSASGAEFIDRFFGEYARRHGVTRWAEKSPANVKCLDFIFEHFPGAHFVHVIRDGRDMACSIRQWITLRAGRGDRGRGSDARRGLWTQPEQGAGGRRDEGTKEGLLSRCKSLASSKLHVRDDEDLRGRKTNSTLVVKRPYTIAEGIELWVEWVGLGRAWKDHPNYLEVRYEDLVVNPEPVLRSLCDAIDLEWDPAMIDYHGRQQAARPELSAAAHAATHQPISPAAVGRWQHELSRAERVVVEEIAGPLLRELDYTCSAGWVDG